MKRRLATTIASYVMLVCAIFLAFGCAAHYGAEQILQVERAEKLADEPMTCNTALQAGFRIYDPEGYEVERFDGPDYWTTTHKP
jgi:hypothetical protein